MEILAIDIYRFVHMWPKNFDVCHPHRQRLLENQQLQRMPPFAVEPPVLWGRGVNIVVAFGLGHPLVFSSYGSLKKKEMKILTFTFNFKIIVHFVFHSPFKLSACINMINT